MQRYVGLKYAVCARCEGEEVLVFFDELLPSEGGMRMQLFVPVTTGRNATFNEGGAR
jgi:hypothetical protein